MIRGGVTRSIRFRITALATAMVVTVLGVTGIVVVALQQRTLVEALDESLAATVATLATEARADELPDAPEPGGDDDAVAQVVTPDGTVVASSAALDQTTPIAPVPTGGELRFRTVEGLGDEDDAYRVASQRIETSRGTVAIHVASPLDDVEDATAALVATLAVALPVAGGVLAGLVWWIVGRTLRPVEGMRAEVASIGAAELDRRVPASGTGDEIDRLATTMNGMLDRIEDATARQSRFVADASHELRTPLTRMRTELEVDLAHPESADPRATQESLLEETIGLQALVDDLLLLARGGVDAAGTPEPVDLAALVRDEVERARRTGIEVDEGGVHPAVIVGRADQLRRGVRNLIDNAVRHAKQRVVVTLDDAGRAGVRLSVTDDGPGIDPADRERIFERFTRLDDARGAETGGAGLGLAITRDIVVRHGGTIVASDPPDGGGAHLVMTLPAAPSPRP